VVGGMARLPFERRSHLAKQRKAGWLGEAFVEKLLRRSGWQILAMRWRCRYGEIDIIAVDRHTLTFVEVKTRSDRNWDYNGSLAITPQKKQHIYEAALEFLAHHPELSNHNYRFDVALVHKSTNEQFRLREYIESAFSISSIA
jgi:putative endonuclease